MGLRRRVWWAFAALLVAMALVFAGVVLAQRSQTLAQVDTQLASLAGNGRALLAVAERADDSGAAAELLGETWVGVRLRTGRVVGVLAPASDPSVYPVLTGNEPLSQAVTRPARGGVTDRMRVLVVPLAAEREVVLAVSLAGVDTSTRRLALLLLAAWLLLAAGLAAVSAWVRRLGLAPIAELTTRADAIAAGVDPASVPPIEGVPAGTEAGRLAVAFNTMLDTTVASRQRLQQFVADASHELRTPLTTLRGYSSLYAQGGLTTPEAVSDAMGRMNAEAARMSRMVDGLLDLTALDGPGALKRADLDLAAMLREIAGDLRVTDPDRAVSVEAPQRLVVKADDDRVRQAVLALVSNARRYSAPDAPITLRAVPGSPSGVRLEVVDRGRGIAPEDLPRVFDRFYRGGKASSRGAGGSGLGLAIVAAIVTAHGGHYGVETGTVPSASGTTFWFTLP